MNETKPDITVTNTTEMTTAAQTGRSESAIMAQTGHLSEKMVRRYIRDGSLFAENVVEGLL